MVEVPGGIEVGMQATGYIERPEIDGLRGIACLIVLVFHGFAQQHPEWGVYLTGTARVGVWLFFVLSAFLLTLRLIETGFSAKTLLDYSIARFLRIVPLFVVAVLAYAAFGMINLTSLGEVLNALALQDPGRYNHLWTVSVEFRFYFVLPLIVLGVLAIQRRTSAIIALFSLLAAIVATILIWRPNTNPDNIIFGKYLACFGFGVMAAFAVKFLPPPSARTASLACLFSLVAIIAFIAIMKSGYFEPATDSISGKHPFFGAMFAIFTYAAYSAKTAWSRALSFKPLAAFGLVIYSTYLFHWFFMDKIPPSHGGMSIPVAIILSILAGTVSYWMFEKPLYRLRKPISSRLNSLLRARRRVGQVAEQRPSATERV